MVFSEMIHLAVLSLLLALVAALLTFSGLLGDAGWIGRVGFVVFLVGFIVAAATTALKRDPPG